MRMRRIKQDGEGYYHVTTRCCMQTFLLKDAESKDMFVRTMRKAEAFCGVEILTYCVMSNHVHILLRVPKREDVSDTLLVERCRALYGAEKTDAMLKQWAMLESVGMGWKAEHDKASLRARMYDLSSFMHTLKLRYSIWFSRHHNFVGTMWQDRFHSTIVEGGKHALSTVAAYIDLNPCRAQITDNPANYAWSGYGAASSGSTQARRGLTSIYATIGGNGYNEAANAYRGLLYEADGAGISGDAVKAALDDGGRMPLRVYLRCKVRYFTDGLFFGSGDFVESLFRQFRDHFPPKRKTGARRIGRCDADGGVKFCTARNLRVCPVTVYCGHAVGK